MTHYDPDFARRFGADVIAGYRSRRASMGCVSAEMFLFGGVAGILSWARFDLTVATGVAIGIIAFIVGLVLFALPIIGTVMSVGMALMWGFFAYSMGTTFGNMFLGLVVGAIVFLVALGLHLGFRD